MLRRGTRAGAHGNVRTTRTTTGNNSYAGRKTQAYSARDGIIESEPATRQQRPLDQFRKSCAKSATQVFGVEQKSVLFSVPFRARARAVIAVI